MDRNTEQYCAFNIRHTRCLVPDRSLLVDLLPESAARIAQLPADYVDQTSVAQ